jgi:hypothetical protein
MVETSGQVTSISTTILPDNVFAATPYEALAES